MKYSIYKIFIYLVILIKVLTCSKSFGFGFELEPYKKSVNFLFEKNGDNNYSPLGTGFYISVKDSINGHFAYLVTAKHVIQKQETDSIIDFIYIRADKRIGGNQYIEIPLITNGDDNTVFTHSDISVDIAVISIIPNPKYFDLAMLPERLLLSKEEISKHIIKEGTDVFFIGLFTPYFGYEKNYPITRFGKVALRTTEKIFWDGYLTELLLIDCSSYGGNSGSPVFYILGPDENDEHKENNIKILRLAGVMKGAYHDINPIQVINNSQTLVSQANMGIGVVVPVEKLYEIIFGDELISRRNLK